MKARNLFLLITSLLLIAGVIVGVVLGRDNAPARQLSHLENVRSYAAAPQVDGLNYAVEGGALFIGNPGSWLEAPMPNGVIAAVVAIDAAHPERVYLGAANELAIYRTENQGRNWQRIALAAEEALMTGSVTALAVDPVQRLVYAGTDTAGLYRLRDVGSSMTLTAHLLTPHPVREIAVDLSGRDLLFARTDWTLYRGENYGLTWVTEDGIGSPPTALAIGAFSGDAAPVVYVGTVDRGVMRSTDGHNWATANEGLNFAPGSRLHVDALVVDPALRDTVYVATSYLYGTTTVQQTPSTVSMGYAQNAESLAWSQVGEMLPSTVAELMPVSGRPGALFALTTTDRAPLALGVASELVAPDVATAPTTIQPVAVSGPNWTSVLAWMIAALAAAALVFAVITDVRRLPTPVAGARQVGERQLGARRLAEQTLPSKR